MNPALPVHARGLSLFIALFALGRVASLPRSDGSEKQKIGPPSSLIASGIGRFSPSRPAPDWLPPHRQPNHHRHEGGGFGRLFCAPAFSISARGAAQADGFPRVEVPPAPSPVVQERRERRRNRRGFALRARPHATGTMHDTPFEHFAAAHGDTREVRDPHLLFHAKKLPIRAIVQRPIPSG
jgi:hypothetical protein